MTRFSFLFVLLLTLLAPAIRGEDYEARTFQGPDGQTLPYRLLTPANYDAQKKYPLVLFLHGAGERGTDNKAQLRHCAPAFAKAEAREKYPCFVVVPQCPPEQKWADIDWRLEKPVQAVEPSAAMKLTLAIIAALEKEFSIDPDRRYVSGISMGGMGTWDLITREPERWAAAVPICGGGDPTKAARAAKVAIWAFHGDMDKAVPVAQTRNMIAGLVAAGAKPLYSEYPNVAHDSWTPAYQEPELFPWLFAQRLGAPVPFATAARPYAQPPSNTFPSAGPVQPGIWFRPLWQGKRSGWAASAATDSGAVVFFGDSITQGWESLAKDFPQLKVANRGISGDTTRGLLMRLQEDVIAVKPRAVSLLIGTNDLQLGAEPTLVARNIQSIVAELHKANPQMPIVLNKVMPRGAQPGKFPEAIQRLNSLLEAAFADDAQVTFCDTWSAFDDGSGAPRREEFPDMLHPNAAGYAKWKAALEPIIAKLKLSERP